MKHQLVVWALVLFTAMNMVCCTDSEDESSSADPALVEAMAQPYGTALVNECIKASACGHGTVDQCLYEYLGNDDGNSIESILTKQLFLDRKDCIAAATECASVDSCFSSSEIEWFEQIVAQPCEGFPETRCEDDQVIWCLGEDGGSATAPTKLVFDLSVMEKTCNGGGTYAADSGHVACEMNDFTYGERCNGTKIENCIDGELLSFDCTHVDPDFVCGMREGDQASCTLGSISSECEGLADDEYLNYARCAGDVAEMCIGGKFIQADCSSFGATCSDDDWGAACVIP